MNKEQIYDAKIMPLMNDVIEVCQRYGIGFFATFDLPTKEQPDLACTTCIGADGQTPSTRQMAMLDIARNGIKPVASEASEEKADVPAPESEEDAPELSEEETHDLYISAMRSGLDAISKMAYEMAKGNQTTEERLAAGVTIKLATAVMGSILK